MKKRKYFFLNLSSCAPIHVYFHQWIGKLEKDLSVIKLCTICFKPILWDNFKIKFRVTKKLKKLLCILIKFFKLKTVSTLY